MAVLACAQHHRGIDDIVGVGDAAELAGSSRAGFVELDDIDDGRLEELREARWRFPQVLEEF